jgi:hypothetical protein
MPLGYEKTEFVTLAGQILIYSTVQLAFMSSELDSKFTLLRTAFDEASFKFITGKFRRFILITLGWITLTSIYFLYAYGIIAMVMYLALSLFILSYNISGYVQVFNIIKEKNHLRGNIFKS